jgi:hypothetical protein
MTKALTARDPMPGIGKNDGRMWISLIDMVSPLETPSIMSFDLNA